MSADDFHRPPAPRAHNRDSLGAFQAVFDSIPYGILVASDDGTIVFANVRASALFAYPPSELPGVNISALIPDEGASPEQARSHWWPTGDVVSVASSRILAGARKDGVMVPLEVGLNVLLEAAARYVVISIEDVTERLTLDSRLASASDEHIGFQRLVANIAGRFSDVEPAALPAAIVDSFRQLGEALLIDQVVLWQWPAAAEAAITPVHWWQRESELPVAPLSVAAVPYMTSKMQRHEALWFTTPEQVPDPEDEEAFRERGIQSSAVIPLVPYAVDSGPPSAVAFSTLTRQIDWAPAIVERLRLIGGVLSQAVARVRTSEALQRALTEVQQLRSRMERVPAAREGRAPQLSNIVVAESPAMKAVLAQVAQVTSTPSTVLLLGETGTGKEVMAQTIHDLSPRHQRSMIRVSCAAIPTALIESELFGRERGAYTGALSRQIGRFEAANQSTLFLDEIGELPAEVQVKLLRVLQERVIERLGSTQSVKVDVRIIAATNRDLEKAVEEKTFREDLFYRLNVFPIVVPPLRDRPEDIPGLVWAFIDEFSRNFGKTVKSIAKESMQELQRYPWPGNVRELRNVIERAVIVSTSPELVVAAPHPPARMPQAAMTLSALEIDHIHAVLESTHWRVRGKGGAAQRLGLKPTTLESRMARLGIVRKKPV